MVHSNRLHQSAMANDAPEQSQVEIKWVRCADYDEAKNHFGVIYLHERDGRPFYWGKADESFFGGHKREYSGLHASGRYNSGYRHWIEGCLRYGARLYIGKPTSTKRFSLGEMEEYLIRQYPSLMNKKVNMSPKSISIHHGGDRPVFLPARTAEV